MGRRFLSFIFEPSTFGRNWVEATSERPSVWSALGFCLTTSAALYATYRLIAKTSVARGLAPELPEAHQGGSEEAGRPRISAATNTLLVAQSSPTFFSQGFEKGFGIGIALPDAATKGAEVPQRVMLQFAWSHFLLEDVIPNSFTAKSTQILFIITMGLIGALCSFLPAWGMQTSAKFADVLPLAIVGMTFWFFYIAVLFFVAATVFRRFWSEIGENFGCLFLFFFFAIVAGVPFHSFYESFKVVYAFGHVRMCLSLLGGLILSAYVAPIIFVPVCNVWLRLGSLFERVV